MDSSADETTAVNDEIRGKIQQLFKLLNIEKVFFVDDLIDLNLSKENFLGLTQAVLAAGKIADLRAITIQGINFNTDEQILLDHISEVWDSTIKPSKQKRYFEKLYTIAGTPDIIKDFTACVGLREFFQGVQIEFLTPSDWDEKKEQLLGQIGEGKRAIVIFDQDLQKGEGRFKDGTKGEQLILELKQLNQPNKVIISLLTHTITSYDQELPERLTICGRIAALKVDDFFVLAKSRLDKPEIFGDGLKKVLLNTYCENVKAKTIEVIKAAQTKTIEELSKLDTYDFDFTVFKTSNSEGVWEPETLLRITDVIFKDAVRQGMIDSNYVPTVNDHICSAKEIAKVEFRIDDPGEPYKTRFALRHQEIYEPTEFINKLRKPIDNGDIFEFTQGELAGRKYILVAQECDLMVRGSAGHEGERGARSATLLQIELLTATQLNTVMTKKYSKDIEKKRFTNHFFADKFKLEYFESGSDKSGLVHFGDSITVDLNILDLIVFNETGEAVINLNAPTYQSSFHNFAWNSRYTKLEREFRVFADALDGKYVALQTVADEITRASLKTDINRQLSFIRKSGVQLNYEDRKFNFGLRRIMRLRNPKAKHLLDRYYLHLSRLAEPHDFAVEN